MIFTLIDHYCVQGEKVVDKTPLNMKTKDNSKSLHWTMLSAGLKVIR